jgi:hypothetical protein
VSAPGAGLASRQDVRARRLLALGALAGIAGGIVSAWMGVTSGAPGPPPEAIALVGGRPILVEEYRRAVESLANDRREPLADGDRARILDRLVEEELLVQHGLSLGLVASDRPVREAVVRAMVESAVAESASRAPSEEELRALYREAQVRRAADAPELPVFETAREGLERALAARARDEALRAYLDALRARTRIERAPAAAP